MFKDTDEEMIVITKDTFALIAAEATYNLLCSLAPEKYETYVLYEHLSNLFCAAMMYELFDREENMERG